MAITEFSDGARLYYRITRSWNNQSHQRYVRIKRSRSAAYKQAQKIDEDLAQRQRAYYSRIELKTHGLLHADGRIIGVNIAKVVRKGRADSWIFKLRVTRLDPGNPQFTTVSITKYGFNDAYNRMVEAYAERAGLTGNEAMIEVLKRAKRVYKAQFAKLSSEAVETTEQPEKEVVAAKTIKPAAKKASLASELESRLRKEIDRFASRLRKPKAKASQ